MGMKANKTATAMTMKHFLISASVGDGASFDMVKQGYPRKDVRKVDYESCSKAYHESVRDLKTDERLASKLFHSGDFDARSTAVIKFPSYSRRVTTAILEVQFLPCNRRSSDMT